MKKAKIDLSNETQKKSIFHIASKTRNSASRVISTASNLPSVGPPRLSSASRSMANIRTSGRNTSNESFGEIVGFLDTIVDDSESSSTNTSKRNERPSRATTTRRGHNTSKSRTSKLSKVTYAESEDDQKEDEEEEKYTSDDANDEEFEDNSDLDVVEESVPKLTRKSRTAAASTTSRRKKAAPEPAKPLIPASSRIPWQNEEQPTTKPTRKSRVTKASVTMESRKTPVRSRGAAKSAAIPKTKQTSLLNPGFNLVSSADPMVCDKYNCFFEPSLC